MATQQKQKATKDHQQNELRYRKRLPLDLVVHRMSITPSLGVILNGCIELNCTFEILYFWFASSIRLHNDDRQNRRYNHFVVFSQLWIVFFFVNYLQCDLWFLCILFFFALPEISNDFFSRARQNDKCALVRYKSAVNVLRNRKYSLQNCFIGDVLSTCIG